MPSDIIGVCKMSSHQVHLRYQRSLAAIVAPGPHRSHVADIRHRTRWKQERKRSRNNRERKARTWGADVQPVQRSSVGQAGRQKHAKWHAA
jgi:hypothetical protein